MTKKDFIVIADSLSTYLFDGSVNDVEHLIDHIAQTLSTHYPNFNKDKFINYINERDPYGIYG